MKCNDHEELISRACDNELSEGEAARLKEHLRGCPSCRKLLGEYRQITDLVAVRQVSRACPPTAPKVPAASVRAPRWRAAIAAAIAACVAAFMVGQYTGDAAATKRFASIIGPTVVTTPSLWSASLTYGEKWAAHLTEEPFTERISHYRRAVARELRSGSVDWAMVRSMVEAIGELRTDLELLTVHMAFLEISTGRSPEEVAQHWEKIGEPNGMERSERLIP